MRRAAGGAAFLFLGVLVATSAACARPPASGDAVARPEIAVEFTSAHEAGASAEPAAMPPPATAPSAVTAMPAAPIAGVQAAAIPTGGQATARVVDRWPTARPFVALSFDAGSDVGYTALILDTLRDQQVHASFGMTGAWAERYPEMLRRMVNEGHHLINHTYDHGSFTGVSTMRAPLSREQRQQQLRRTEEVVRSLTGVEMRPYFRPPFGDYDASVNADVAVDGYRYNVMWTVDSLGWNGLSANGIVERCLARAAPGAIYVFHVGSQSQDGPALRGIIDGLRRQGYGLGTVADLIGG